MQNLLEGKVILITGSARGIGAATARLAKEYGATVILHGKEESDHLQALAKELGCTYITCDVADEAAVKTAVEKVISEVGKIDVLVNCAGIAIPNSFMETSEEDWLRVFKVNVVGTANFCKVVLPTMQQQGNGRIVNIASIRGFASMAYRPSYSSSKAAIIDLTAALAKEFAPSIAVNAVAPGFTNTEMTKVWNETVWNQAKSSLLGRIAEPTEIAEAILFLASDKASFITGQTILVDGGYSISGK